MSNIAYWAQAHMLTDMVAGEQNLEMVKKIVAKEVEAGHVKELIGQTYLKVIEERGAHSDPMAAAMAYCIESNTARQVKRLLVPEAKAMSKKLSDGEEIDPKKCSDSMAFMLDLEPGTIKKDPDLAVAKAICYLMENRIYKD